MRGARPPSRARSAPGSRATRPRRRRPAAACPVWSYSTKRMPQRPSSRSSTGRAEVRALGERDGRARAARARAAPSSRRAMPGRVEQRVAALELAEPRLGRGAGRVAVARVEELARLAGRRRTARSSSGRRASFGESSRVRLRAWPTPRSASTRRRPRSSRGSRSSARARSTPAPRRRPSGSARRGSCSRASGPRSSATRARSSSSTATSATARPSSAWTSGGRPATPSSPATARCSGGA